MALVHSLHFLQEDHVGGEGAQALAQLVDHHAAVEMRQALVDVERHDAQAAHALHQRPALPARRSISATIAVNCSSTLLRSAAGPMSGGRSKSGSMSPI